QRAETARQAEEEHRRTEAARLEAEQNLSRLPRPPKPVRPGFSRLWIFVGILIGAGILFAVILTLSLNSSNRAARVSTPEPSLPPAVSKSYSPPSTSPYPPPANQMMKKYDDTARQAIEKMNK